MEAYVQFPSDSPQAASSREYLITTPSRLTPLLPAPLTQVDIHSSSIAVAPSAPVNLKHRLSTNSINNYRKVFGRDDEELSEISQYSEDLKETLVPLLTPGEALTTATSPSLPKNPQEVHPSADTSDSSETAINSDTLTNLFARRAAFKDQVPRSKATDCTMPPSVPASPDISNDGSPVHFGLTSLTTTSRKRKADRPETGEAEIQEDVLTTSHSSKRPRRGLEPREAPQSQNRLEENLSLGAPRNKYGRRSKQKQKSSPGCIRSSIDTNPQPHKHPVARLPVVLSSPLARCGLESSSSPKKPDFAFPAPPKSRLTAMKKKTGSTVPSKVKTPPAQAPPRSRLKMKAAPTSAPSADLVSSLSTLSTRPTVAVAPAVSPAHNLSPLPVTVPTIQTAVVAAATAPAPAAKTDGAPVRRSARNKAASNVNETTSDQPEPDEIAFTAAEEEIARARVEEAQRTKTKKLAAKAERAKQARTEKAEKASLEKEEREEKARLKKSMRAEVARLEVEAKAAVAVEAEVMDTKANKTKSVKAKFITTDDPAALDTKSEGHPIKTVVTGAPTPATLATTKNVQAAAAEEDMLKAGGKKTATKPRYVQSEEHSSEDVQACHTSTAPTQAESISPQNAGASYSGLSMPSLIDCRIVIHKVKRRNLLAPPFGQPDKLPRRWHAGAFANINGIRGAWRRTVRT